MAQRPIWRGHLRLALVSCPVALYAAHHERNALRFNMINPKTGNRISMRTVDAETKEEVARGDTVKGYEFKKDHYLILTDDDFEAVRVPSSTVMVIDKFVPKETLDPIYYDTSYYLAPDGDQGEDVYAVLRDAIADTGRVALSRVVMSRRERVIAIVTMEQGLAVHTLHEARDLNSSAGLYDRVPKSKTDPEMVKLATQLVERQTGTYDPADIEDRYETRLRAMIEAKLKGEGLDDTQAEEPDRGNVIDIMAALKASLAGRQKDGPPSTPSPMAAPSKGSRPKAASEPPKVATKSPRKRA